MPILYALLTIVAWGIWLIPSQNVRFSGQQVRAFYVAAANLLISALFTAVQGFDQVTSDVFWLPFLGGMVWSLGGGAAFSATEKLGPVRAYGIWAPLNIMVSLALGAVLFHEFGALSDGARIVLFGSVALIVDRLARSARLSCSFLVSRTVKIADIDFQCDSRSIPIRAG